MPSPQLFDLIRYLFDQYNIDHALWILECRCSTSLSDGESGVRMK
jgi:hypothetical protein